MSNELTPYSAPRLPDAPRTAVAPFTRQGRAVAKLDKSTELQARQDFNDARLAVHRTHLDTIIEKAKNQARAELVEDTLLHARAVDDLATQLSAGKPALEMTLRELQAAWTTGETQRILRRGMSL
ncbi:hypothetical protein [Mycobacteroides abscessus]|uniref:hypothetical protein n=1 Tax=Mycobacteroides abscessus TaxID=36809 RepID=UPI0012FFF4EB|nr:hypothetical protein [Mycobacteroides abscessus]